MKKVNWGILGPGIIARQFAADFTHARLGHLRAVASRSEDRASEFAQEFGIEQAYGSYQALYEDPEIDIIYIATPHSFHLRQSMEALQLRKAVLCEKPITVSSNQLDQLVHQAQLSNQYLAEGMWTYFLPVFRKAQAWIAEGRLGEIYHIKSDFGYPVPYEPEGRMYNPQLAGGSLLDMGVYVVAMAWLFLKQDPLDMKVIAREAPSGVDHDVSILLEYPNASAQLNCAFRCKLHNWTFIIGEKGYIAIPDFWRARECYFYEGEKVQEHYQDGRSGHGFEFEIDAVSQDLLDSKKESAIVPLQYSMKLQEHMQQIKEHFQFNRISL